MRKTFKLSLIFFIFVALFLISGCSQNTNDEFLLGDFYSVKVIDGTKDLQGQPIKFITVITLQKDNSGKRYHFKQSVYSQGRSQVTDRVLAGSYDQKTRTLKIGDLQPLVYDNTGSNITWAGEKYTRITSDNEKKFDSLMEEALKQRALKNKNESANKKEIQELQDKKTK